MPMRLTPLRPISAMSLARDADGLIFFYFYLRHSLLPRRSPLATGEQEVEFSIARGEA